MVCELFLQAATIVDIDAPDLGNELAVIEYVGEIYKFYKSVEVYILWAKEILSRLYVIFGDLFLLCRMREGLRTIWIHSLR